MKRNNGSFENDGVYAKPRGNASYYARVLWSLTVLCLTTGTAYGQTDPWSKIAGNFGQVFSGGVAKGLALVSIVVGGLEIAFGTGHSARTIGGLIFGLGLALGGANFVAWLIS